jgi:phosphoesterase RecJ-like protein
MTDTGSFSFACNYPETFKTAAALLSTGINAESIHRKVYDTYSESRLRLLGFCLSEKLTVLPEFSTAYIALSRAELDRFNYQVGDTEGIVNYALSIDNIKLAVLLTERKDRIRVSFRSKGDLSVNKIANEHFNGGGHRNAAGGDSYVSLDDTIKKLKEVLVQYRDDIDRSTAF